MLPARKVLLRDGVIFMLKLWIDGLKDVALTAAAIAALAFDFARGRRAKRYAFYRVMRLGERIDLWLNLYGASEKGARSAEGLFAASRAGEDSFLGKLEKLTGGERGEKPR